MLLCLASVPLGLLSFPPFDHWYLAYVALVPLGLGIVLCRSRRWAMLGAYVAGVVFWAIGVYWLTWVTLLGYVAAVAYLGTYWLAAGAVLRAARPSTASTRRWPMWLVVPIIWVALEYLREFVISGFPWLLLAHSQHTLTTLIQVSDLTGQYGLSFFVAMVNGLVIDLVLWRLSAKARPCAALEEAGTSGISGDETRRAGTIVAGGVSPRCAAGIPGAPKRRHLLAQARISGLPVFGFIVTFASAIFLLGYGYFRLHQDAQSPGPRVGVVQQSYPISLFHQYADCDDIYAAFLASSEELVGKKCDLVVWPETMLPAPNMEPEYWFGLNPDMKDPRDPSKPCFSPAVQEMIACYQAYLRRMDELLAKLGCPLLVGGTMPARGFKSEERLYENAAMLFDRDCPASTSAAASDPTAPCELRLIDWYGKMHLVPFGEYVPWRRSFPWAFSLLRQFVPPAMAQLEPGRRATVFRFGPQRQWSLAAPICYEGAFARVCRHLATDRPGKLSLLVNISNDGWFVYQGADGSVTPSFELDQHLAQYQFRAVENRVPVVRAVNCGISGYIDSNGRVVEVLQRAGQSRMVCGTMVAQVLVDGRVSPYSLSGDIFAQADSLVGAGLIVLLWRNRKRGS